MSNVSNNGGDDSSAGKKLFVGGLPYSMTAEEVQALFTDAGDLNLVVASVYLPVDRMQGNRPRGFGFVEYTTAEDAQKAIAKFNGFEVQGRKLTVNEARPQQPRGN